MNLKEVIVLIVIMTLAGVLAQFLPIWARWSLLGLIMGGALNYIGNKRN